MKALVVREILVAARAGGGAALGLAFFLIVVLITALGLGRDIDLLAKAAPGTLWVGSLLATLLWWTASLTACRAIVCPNTHIWRSNNQKCSRWSRPDNAFPFSNRPHLLLACYITNRGKLCAARQHELMEYFFQPAIP